MSQQDTFFSLAQGSAVLSFHQLNIEVCCWMSTRGQHGYISRGHLRWSQTARKKIVIYFQLFLHIIRQRGKVGSRKAIWSSWVAAAVNTERSKRPKQRCERVDAFADLPRQMVFARLRSSSSMRCSGFFIMEAARRLRKKRSKGILSVCRYKCICIWQQRERERVSAHR